MTHNPKHSGKITKFIALMIFLFQPFFLETWAKTKQVLWSHKFHKQAFIKQQKGQDSHASRVVTKIQSMVSVSCKEYRVKDV